MSAAESLIGVAGTVIIAGVLYRVLADGTLKKVEPKRPRPKRAKPKPRKVKPKPRKVKPKPRKVKPKRRKKRREKIGFLGY